jgi:hypothetical protein
MNYSQLKSAIPALSASAFGLNTDGMPVRHEAKAQMASIAQEGELKDNRFLFLLSHGQYATLFPVDAQTNLAEVQMKYLAKHDIMNRDLDFSAIYHRGSCIASVTPNGRLYGQGEVKLDSLEQARERVFGPAAYVNDSIRFYALAEALKPTPGWTRQLDSAVHDAGKTVGIEPKDAALAALDLLKGKAFPSDFHHPVLGPMYAGIVTNIAKAFPEHYDALLKDVVTSLRNVAPELTPHLPNHDEPAPPQAPQKQPSVKPR